MSDAGPAIFISLTIGIGSGVTAAEVTTGWVSYAIPAILFLLFFLVIPILLSTTGQSFFFKVGSQSKSLRLICLSG